MHVSFILQTDVDKCIHTYIYIYIYTYIYIYMYAYIYIYHEKYAYMHIHTCMYTRTFLFSLSLYIYICIDIISYDAEVIYVLKNGRCCEQGSHDELMELRFDSSIGY